MFALNSTHYARWLPVHIGDTEQLHDTHRDVYDKFVQCHFTAHKSAQVLSSIVLDQNHEQLNQLIKGDGGAVGITEHPDALLRWMVAGSEVTRLVNELEYTQHEGRDSKHHKQTSSAKIEFQNNLKDMIRVIEEMENPFLDKDLYCLDTKVITDPSVVYEVQSIETCRKEQYDIFAQGRLVI